MISDRDKLLSELRAIQIWDTDYFREVDPDRKSFMAFEARQSRRREILEQLHKQEVEP